MPEIVKTIINEDIQTIVSYKQMAWSKVAGKTVSITGVSKSFSVKQIADLTIDSWGSGQYNILIISNYNQLREASLLSLDLSKMLQN